MGYLIDTNILIYRLKNQGNVNENFLRHKDEGMTISVISYGELVYGARKSKSAEKNLETVRAIRSIFPILDVTPDVMERFGGIKAHTQKIGRPTDDMDLLIAATALANGLTLVTHNTRHFEHIPELQAEDWF